MIFQFLNAPSQDKTRYDGRGPFNALARGQPPVVLLQHDADHTPYKTVDLMNMNIRWVFAVPHISLRTESKQQIRPYTLDIERLKSLENSGFEIGYHLNAYELLDTT